MENKDYSSNSPYVMDNLTQYPEELALLLSIATAKEYTPGEHVYLQKEASRHRFFMIESGKIKISILRDDGSEKILAIQEKNTFFGEASALDGHPYFATATALERTRVQIINVADFLRLAAKHPKAAFVIMASLARMIRLLVMQIEDFSFLDAQKRVAHMVFKLLSEVGEKTAEGMIIRKKLTHEDLARLTSLSRVSVSLALNKLEEQKILRKKRYVIEVTDLERLKSVMGSK
ncbi:MAG: Crp/Fnr family transcriptional regulator [Syntrophorhabdales bacterium]